MKFASFDIIFADAIKKYQSKIPQYGESWKEMSFSQLLERLEEEYEELADCEGDYEKGDAGAYEEALDVINVAMMIASHLSHARKETEVFEAEALRTPPTTEVVGIRAGNLLSNKLSSGLSSGNAECTNNYEYKHRNADDHPYC